jgi:hypothetical protein
MVGSSPQFGKWHADGCPFSIEYSLDAMERVRQHVMEGFYAMPRGGAEVGGVLMGRKVDGIIRILAARPATCEYSMGPTFTLSARDEAVFKTMVAAGHLGGMQPVGWYRSRTRNEPHLSEKDVDLWRRFFPHDWQPALVLRPASMGVMRAAFFFREPDGSVCTQSPYPELQLQPVDAGDGMAQFTDPEPEPPRSIAVPGATPGVIAPARAVVTPAPRFANASAATKRRAVVATLSVASLVSAAFLFRDQLAGAAEWWEGPPLNLRLEKERDGILVRWDARAEAITNATGATLDVEASDGSSVIPLNAMQLRNGFAAVRSKATAARVRLILRQPDGKTLVHAISR